MSELKSGRKAFLCALLVSPLLAITACSEQRSSAWSGYAEGDHLYLSASVAGTLSSLNVRSGATVNTGAALFQLDDGSARAALAEADARLAATQAQAADTGTGKRVDELAVATAQLAQA